MQRLVTIILIRHRRNATFDGRLVTEVSPEWSGEIACTARCSLSATYTAMFPTHIIRDATKVLCTNWNQGHFDAFQMYESQSFLVENSAQVPHYYPGPHRTDNMLS